MLLEHSVYFITQADPVGINFRLVITSSTPRQAVEDAIDRLIGLLDQLDGDPDLEDGGDDEPWLAAPEGLSGQFYSGPADDREIDADFEPDFEPDLEIDTEEWAPDPSQAEPRGVHQIRKARFCRLDPHYVNQVSST